MILVLLLLLLPQAVTHCCSGSGRLPDCMLMQDSELLQWESRVLMTRLRRTAADEDTKSSMPARPAVSTSQCSRRDKTRVSTFGRC